MKWINAFRSIYFSSLPVRAPQQLRVDWSAAVIRLAAVKTVSASEVQPPCWNRSFFWCVCVCVYGGQCAVNAQHLASVWLTSLVGLRQRWRSGSSAFQSHVLFHPTDLLNHANSPTAHYQNPSAKRFLLSDDFLMASLFLLSVPHHLFSIEYVRSDIRLKLPVLFWLTMVTAAI